MDAIRPTRRHDIDQLRVIAIGLLLVYHVAVAFQSWSLMVGFIAHVPALEAIWPPMTLLNIWRIPLLFFVSGMGVALAFGRRSAAQLLRERSRRILVPLIFGALCIVPLHMFILQSYYQWPLSYSPGPGHLWFLGNIFVYTLCLLPLLYWLQHQAASAWACRLRKVMASPAGWLILVAAFWAEAWILKPLPYELYAMTAHGFVLGLLAFVFGYLFVYCGVPFWQGLERGRWVLLITAACLFAYRSAEPLTVTPSPWLAIESNAWVLAVLAFSYRHLNRPSPVMAYLSRAAYPVYILHMVFLYLAAAWLFPIDMNLSIKFVAVLSFTLGGCLLCYELVIRRVRWIRPLFGLRYRA